MAYTVKGLAEKWECSPKHVYNLIHSGHLRCFSIGTRRGTRISDKEVERWEESEKNLIGTETSRSDGQMGGGLPTTAMAALANVRG